jgi:hypothetical protein
MKTIILEVKSAEDVMAEFSRSWKSGKQHKAAGDKRCPAPMRISEDSNFCISSRFRMDTDYFFPPIELRGRPASL